MWEDLNQGRGLWRMHGGINCCQTRFLNSDFLNLLWMCDRNKATVNQNKRWRGRVCTKRCQRTWVDPAKPLRFDQSSFGPPLWMKIPSGQATHPSPHLQITDLLTQSLKLWSDVTFLIICPHYRDERIMKTLDASSRTTTITAQKRYKHLSRL